MLNTRPVFSTASTSYPLPVSSGVTDTEDLCTTRACNGLRCPVFPTITSRACVQVLKLHRAVADTEAVVPTFRMRDE